MDFFEGGQDEGKVRESLSTAGSTLMTKQPGNT